MNIAIIPARGGSKRIPKKNIKDFLGKEILAYSIEAAFESKCFDKVIVSTDCDEISSVAKKYGASCDELRPDYLSDDYVGTSDVIKYEINRLIGSGIDLNIVSEIYATAPLMKPEFIVQGIDLLISRPKNSYVFSAVEFEYPVQRGFEIANGSCIAVNPTAFLTRSQDLTPIYHDAAQFYIGHVETWCKNEFRFNDMAYPLVLPREIVVDIDTESDWKIAEAIFKYSNIK